MRFNWINPNDPTCKLTAFEEPAPDPNAPPAGGPPAPNPNPPIVKDPEITAAERDELRRLREDKVKLETERNTLKAEKDEADRKRLEEEGKWQELAKKEKERADAETRRVAEVTTESQRAIIESELKARLAMEGVSDLDLAILAKKDLLKFENGSVTGLDDCVKDLKERKPHIFGAPRALNTTTNSPTPSPSPKPLEVKSVKDLSPADYAKAKRDLIRGLSRRRA